MPNTNVAKGRTEMNLDEFREKLLDIANDEAEGSENPSTMEFLLAMHAWLDYPEHCQKFFESRIDEMSWGDFLSVLRASLIYE